MIKGRKFGDYEFPINLMDDKRFAREKFFNLNLRNKFELRFEKFK